MPIEIKELLVRAIWGQSNDQSQRGITGDKSKNKDSANARARSEDELRELQASLKKMLDQSQER